MESAVIQTGGKQYRVAKGDVISIERLPASKEGDKVTFDQVLLVSKGKEVQLGAPVVKGVSVEGVIEKEGKDKKIDVIKYKPKSRYFKKRGHRQPFHKVKITKIS